ncbi:MAG: NAD(+) synthase [Treponemataceae bacterium]|nr:MAG: NAD(+) synthase [Treponemataceae bacterium]
MSNFSHGFIRVAAAVPETVVADCHANAERITELIQKAHTEKCAAIAFPELCITSYTAGDLFLQTALQKGAWSALEAIAKKTKNILAVVGLPVAKGNALYNCAAFLHNGKILALVPKTYIPNNCEFYEKRYFASACTLGENENLETDFGNIPFGTNILVADKKYRDIAFAAEICEDVWAASPPSSRHALNGALVIANLSASNEVIGKAQYRRTLVTSQAARLVCAYVYANAGSGESTTDMVFSGHSIISENGVIHAEKTPFSGSESEDLMIFADIDSEQLLQERRKTTSYSDCAGSYAQSALRAGTNAYRRIEIDLLQESAGSTQRNEQKLYRKILALPFVPQDSSERTERCREVICMQAAGLEKRLRHTKARTAVIGLSGGLDSTLALLVICEAFRNLGKSFADIIAVTMPCFGTTERTVNNARLLAISLNVTLREIPIARSVEQHFLDIGHNKETLDVTYENAQARERTQVLMDIANQTNGLVIGTGDLSEMALGWATYNGDHMSMYAVNISIPKTLVRHLVEWFAIEDEKSKNPQNIAKPLLDILETPVSPELLPPTGGKISQRTEDLVGPYELHDFFLYYMLRFGFSPKKIFFLATIAFDKTTTNDKKSQAQRKYDRKIYDQKTILKWMRVFYSRFFAQQFKRSCLPDGAKVGTVSISPRGDWRMPSDASAAVWLSELDAI